MEQAEQQDQHVEHQEGAAGFIQMSDQPGLPAETDQHLRFGQAGIGKAQVAPTPEQCEQHRLADHHQRTADGHRSQGLLVVPREKCQPQQQQSQSIGGRSEGKAFEQKTLNGVMGQSLTHRAIRG
ncbi:hypothetical protein D3C81_1752630 [compost metagenome]